MNIRRATAHHPAITSLLAMAFVFAIVFILTGCGGVQPASAPDPKASVAAEPEATLEPVVTPPPVNKMVVQLGQVFTYENNVSISVGVPEPYEPSQYAAGGVEGQPAVKFQVVLTNNSDDVLEPMVYETVASGGQQASSIFDMDIMASPTTTLLQGDTVTWWVAYSVIDPADIKFEVAPSFEYKKAIFTNRLP